MRAAVTSSRAMDMDRATELYERAMFTNDSNALEQADRELDAAEADLSFARGRVMHVRYLWTRKEDPRELELLTRAVELYRSLGDVRGEAEALFWVGTAHQVVYGDRETALPYFERSYELATQIDDKLTLSYAARHLGFIEQAAGRADAARARFEESVRLRREIGFLPGVAAGLLTLGQCTGDESVIAEAAVVARECGATAVLGWIEQR